MIHTIKTAVCDYFGIDPVMLGQKSRKGPVVKGRHFVIYFIRLKYPNYTLKYIGSLFNRDHSTIICALDKIEGYLQCNVSYRRNFEEIQKKISDLNNPLTIEGEVDQELISLLNKQ